jgi:hypothetical protein
MSLLRVRLAAALAVAAAVVSLAAGVGADAAYGLTKPGTVISYDRRSLMVDGRRELFFSGSIHYPRSPPHEWPDLISRAKEGGLNVIESYVFWNIHEPEMGVVTVTHSVSYSSDSFTRAPLA